MKSLLPVAGVVAATALLAACAGGVTRRGGSPIEPARDEPRPIALVSDRYDGGELVGAVDAAFDPTMVAVQWAVAELKLGRVSQKVDSAGAELIVRTAEDKRVEIHVEPEGAKSTRVRVRAGVMGEEELSRSVLAKIRAGLLVARQ